MILKSTGQFRKDFKRCIKRGLDRSLLEKVIDDLLAGKQLDKKHLDHELTGKYAGFRECHIQSDWLLIYRKNEETMVLTAMRTGTHSDLFDL